MYCYFEICLGIICNFTIVYNILSISWIDWILLVFMWHKMLDYGEITQKTFDWAIYSPLINLNKFQNLKQTTIRKERAIHNIFTIWTVLVFMRLFICVIGLICTICVLHCQINWHFEKEKHFVFAIFGNNSILDSCTW